MFNKQILTQDIHTIVIARGDMLGDMVLTTGIISPLKKAFPKARLLFIVQKEFVDVLDRHPDVDECIADPMDYSVSIWSWTHWKQFFLLLSKLRSLQCDLFIGALMPGLLLVFLYLIYPDQVLFGKFF